jgi:hypothetical protein
MDVEASGGESRDQHCCFVIQAVKPYHYDLNQILALPSGFRYRNRYDQRWVDPNLHGNIGRLKERDLLIVMRDKERNRLVPARWATIDAAQAIGGILYFEYILGGFVVYRNDPNDREEDIADYTETLRRFRSGLPGRPGEDLMTPSVFETAAGYTFDQEPEDDLTHWGNVVQAVATASVYEKVDFLRVVDLRAVDSTPAPVVDEQYQVSPNTVYLLRVFQQVPNFGDGLVTPHDLELRAFPDDVASLRSRQRAVGKYDMLTFVLRVLDLRPNDRTSIEIEHERTDERGEDASTSLYIPLIVVPRSRLVDVARLAAIVALVILIFRPDFLPGEEEVVRNVATVLFVLFVAGLSRTLSALWPSLPWRST